ncbi:MAG: hypothetical protein M1358_01295 [Chloroflexi bacterium]|nr:hypothetical protein [Chloroflexota bacterium]
MDEKQHRQVLENAAYEMGTLYYFLAKNVIEAYGEGAKEVIRKGVREWGAAKRVLVRFLLLRHRKRSLRSWKGEARNEDAAVQLSRAQLRAC